MQITSAANDAIAIVGQTLGLELELDENLGCAIAFEQLHRVEITFSEDWHFLVNCQLVEASADENPERLAAALTYNLSAEGPDRRFGYDPETRRILLQSRADAGGEDPLEIAEALAAELVFAAEICAKITQQSSETAEEEFSAPSDDDNVAGAAFIHV